MRRTICGVIALGAVALTGAVHAQGFTPQELDRLSKEQRDSGAFRSFAAPPAPPRATVPTPLHPVQGMWICMSTTPYAKILAEPRSGAAVIGQSSGEVAAGADRNGYTSILYREGVIGWLPKGQVRPYQNEFNPRASCTVGGIRPNGVVTFDVR